MLKKKPTRSEEKFCFTDREGNHCLSPSKMMEFLISVADRSIHKLGGEVTIDGKLYKVKKAGVGAPYTLFLQQQQGGFSCEIDLVPAVSLKIKKLPHNMKQHAVLIKKIFQSDVKKCMAIALRPADMEQFEIDFYDIEVSILRTSEVGRKVVMLLKHLRDIKGGPLKKFRSHMLKTMVLHKIIMWYAFRKVKPSSCWDEENLEECLLDCLRSWLDHIDNGLQDIFFPGINLMDRLRKHSEAVQNTKKFISGLLFRIHFHSLTWEKVKTSLIVYFIQRYGVI